MFIVRCSILECLGEGQELCFAEELADKADAAGRRVGLVTDGQGNGGVAGEIGDRQLVACFGWCDDDIVSADEGVDAGT